MSFTLIQQWTKTFCILLQCSLGIDVIENFHYMNGVNKTN